MTALAPANRRESEFRLPIGYTDDEGKTHRAVVLRKMTGKEEAILADRRFQRNGGKLVTELLHSCLVQLGDLKKNGSDTIEDLYSADRNYLLLKLRSITFGSAMPARYTCPSCGEATQVDEDLEDLPVRALSEGESLEEITLELEDGYVDKDGQVHRSVRMRLPTGADEAAVAAQMRQNASLGKNALLSRCLISLGDLPRHRVEAIGPKILSELTLTDRRMIDRALNESAPGVEMVRHVDCPGCGQTFKTTLDLSHFLALE
jgi:hypothetical protein